MPGKTKKALVLFIVVSVAVGVGAAFLPSPKAYLLTRRAKRVMPLPSKNPQYQWLSDYELAMSALYPPQPLTHVDTRTGAALVWADFHRRTSNYANDAGITISADCKRALWNSVSGNDYAVTSAPLDGSSITTRVRNHKEFWTTASNPVWMSNSMQWVQILAGENSLYAVVEGISSPGILRKVAIGNPNGTVSSHDLMQTRLLGCTRDGRILATIAGYDEYNTPGPQRQIDFYEFSVDGGPARLIHYNIGLPKAGNQYDNNVALARDEEVELSPNGGKLAWLVHVIEPEPPLRKWLARWILAMRTVPHPRIELRTSRIDGSEMKVIGYLEPDQKNQRARHDPHGLRWLRNGQEVSFLYDGALWTVPTK